jgi:hypothetical protein
MKTDRHISTPQRLSSDIPHAARKRPLFSHLVSHVMAFEELDQGDRCVVVLSKADDVLLIKIYRTLIRPARRPITTKQECWASQRRIQH